MIEHQTPARPGQCATSHFDRRSAQYDQAGIHHRVAAVLAAGAALAPGHRVLDIATGTGILAFEAAKRVGPSGSVLGVDISEGMLAAANRKADATGLRNIRFALGDAERLDLAGTSFDRVMAASALVLMSDIPRALRHWSGFLEPNGILAFDAPARPFGLGARVAEVASAHGIQLGYAEVADTPDKCRSLLAGAGLEVVAVNTELAESGLVGLDAATAFLDEHVDHPAWRSFREAPGPTRAAIRTAYIANITAAAVDGQVANDTALNFVFGRKLS